MADGKGNVFANDILALILNGTAIANIAQNGASPLTNLYVALHTASPEGGDQTTNEIAYTGYARVAVPRDGTGWAGADGQWDNEAAINFPACTGGTAAATHFSVGTLASGAGKVLYCGALTATLNISNGITPSFPAGDLNINED